MKVTVNVYLNARSNQPTTLAPNPLYRIPGDTLEIDDALIGEAIEGNSVWYHSTDGNYYWSGGIADTDFQLTGKNFTDLNASDQVALLTSLKNEQCNIWAQKVEGYVACGIGLKNNSPEGPTCLVIYVAAKKDPKELSFSVPQLLQYKGFTVPTDVKVGGPFVSRGYDTLNQQYYQQHFPPDQQPCLVGGSVCSDVQPDNWGTRGPLVVKDGEVYIFSCFHVLFPGRVSTNVRIEITDAADVGRFPALSAHPGADPRSVISGTIKEGVLDPLYDFGLLGVNPAGLSNQMDQHQFAAELLRVSGHYAEDEVAGIKGMQVKTYGAQSGFQIGRITDINIDTEIKVGGVSRHYSNLIITEKISEPGDSGAPVVGFDNRIVGYIVGGSAPGDPNPVSALLPWYNLHDCKKIDLYEPNA